MLQSVLKIIHILKLPSEQPHCIFCQRYQILNIFRPQMVKRPSWCK